MGEADPPGTGGLPTILKEFSIMSFWMSEISFDGRSNLRFFDAVLRPTLVVEVCDIRNMLAAGTVVGSFSISTVTFFLSSGLVVDFLAGAVASDNGGFSSVGAKKGGVASLLLLLPGLSEARQTNGSFLLVSQFEDLL